MNQLVSTRQILAIITISLLLVFANNATADTSSIPEDAAERQLLNALSLAESAQWQQAETLATKLCQDYKNFNIADLLRKNISQQMLPAPTSLVKLNEQDDEYLENNLIAELYLRKQARRNKTTNLQPSTILKLSDKLRYLFLFDLESFRLYLLKNSNGKAVILADYYIGIGKQGYPKQYRGDLRTPVGIYTITKKLNDAQLSELYGIGAFPLDYPNYWDKHLKRTGSGIWLHGVPRNTYSRPPYSSRGCVTLSNHIFSGLTPFVSVGNTTVILSPKVGWVESESQKTKLNTILAALQQWQLHWSSLDFDNYISHYSNAFFSERGDLSEWKAHKYRINKNKTKIEVSLHNISIFDYPGESGLVQIDFEQHYKSNNFNARSNKRQLWKQDDDQKWHILYEGIR